MSTPNFSELIEDLNVMSAAITTRQASVSGVGITAADATALAAFATDLVAFDAEQEELKAQLKAKTKAIETMMAEAKARHAKLSKLIKVAVPQEEWVAFGITAKK